MDLLIFAQSRRGNLVYLAKSINKSYAEVHQWMTGKRKVPVELCPNVTLVTGVPLKNLRPDIDWKEKLNTLKLAIRVE